MKGGREILEDFGAFGKKELLFGIVNGRFEYVRKALLNPFQELVNEYRLCTLGRTPKKAIIQ